MSFPPCFKDVVSTLEDYIMHTQTESLVDHLLHLHIHPHEDRSLEQTIIVLKIEMEIRLTQSYLA